MVRLKLEFSIAVLKNQKTTEIFSKYEIELFFSSYIGLQLNKHVNVNLNNLKLLKENNREYLKDLEVGRTFSNKTQKSQTATKNFDRFN